MIPPATGWSRRRFLRRLGCGALGGVIASAWGRSHPSPCPSRPRPGGGEPAAATDLSPADRALLLRLQRQALRYFLDNQAPGGLVLDRQRNHGPRRRHGLCSTAATGMGLIALALAAAPPYRLLTPQAAALRVRAGLRAKPPVVVITADHSAEVQRLRFVAPGFEGANLRFERGLVDADRVVMLVRRDAQCLAERRQQMIFVHLRKALDRVLVLDPGHGGADPGSMPERP